MKFKTLKHKTLEDTFGYVIDLPQDDRPGVYQWEIAHSSIPVLQPMTATMEMAIEYWNKVHGGQMMGEYLKEYDMVEVEVIVI